MLQDQLPVTPREMVKKSDRAPSGGEHQRLRQVHGDSLVLKSGAENASLLSRLLCSSHPRVSLHCSGDCGGWGSDICGLSCLRHSGSGP